MHVFSTVLFVNGNPIGYKVFRQEGQLILNPAENPNRDVRPPAIYARNEGGQWHIEGTSDYDLIAQVVEDITMNEGRLPTALLSAAP